MPNDVQLEIMDKTEADARGDIAVLEMGKQDAGADGSQMETMGSKTSSDTMETVTYRRVQGGNGYNASQFRIEVNEDGTINIPNKTANLSISIDDGEHARYFSSKRGNGVQIIEFEVPKWFDDFLQESAIQQRNYKVNPFNQDGLAPKITDSTTPGKSYELPAPWIEWLEEYAKNARIVHP